MQDLDAALTISQARSYLHRATRISGDHHLGAARDNRIDFFVKDGGCHFRMHEIVNSTRSTATVTVFEMHEIETGYLLQEIRDCRLGNLLTVDEMTGLVVGDFFGELSIGLRNANFIEELANITNRKAKALRTRFGRFLERRATTRGIDHQNVGLDLGENRGVSFIELVCFFQEPGMAMESATTRLGVGNDHITTGAVEHTNRRPVCRCKPLTGNAAQKQNHPHAGLSFGRVKPVGTVCIGL